MKEITLIKRYQNRKLYDTTLSKYVTLTELKDRMVDGEEFTCVDNKTKNDITNFMLKQVLLTKTFSTEKLKELVLQG